MNNKAKYLFSLLILIGLILACSGNKSDKDKQNTQTQYKDTTKINKDQYRMDEKRDTGNKDKIIDLVKGTVTFVVVNYSSNHLKVTLKYPDGREVAVLADVNEQYNGKVKVEVPETTAYVLDIVADGEWSVWRE